MKIVVVGANGYIARNLILKLAIQHEIFSFVKKYPQSRLNEDHMFETIDLTQVRTNIINIQPDIIINLASSYSAQHNYVGIKTIVDTEISLSAHLAEICCEFGIYLIQTKSLFQKSEKGSGINLYAASKNARDELMQYFITFNKLKLINILLGDVYGYADNRKKLIPSVIIHIKSESKSHFSLENPNRKFYPTYLDDVLTIIGTVLNKIETGVIESGDVQCFQLDGMTLQNFVNTVQSIVSKARFQVSWLAQNTEFRETELVTPRNLISIMSEFTSFETGFQTVLKLSDIK